MLSGNFFILYFFLYSSSFKIYHIESVSCECSNSSELNLLSKNFENASIKSSICIYCSLSSIYIPCSKSFLSRITIFFSAAFFLEKEVFEVAFAKRLGKTIDFSRRFCYNNRNTITWERRTHLFKWKTAVAIEVAINLPLIRI